MKNPTALIATTRSHSYIYSKAARGVIFIPPLGCRFVPPQFALSLSNFSLASIILSFSLCITFSLLPLPLPQLRNSSVRSHCVIVQYTCTHITEGRLCSRGQNPVYGDTSREFRIGLRKSRCAENIEGLKKRRSDPLYEVYVLSTILCRRYVLRANSRLSFPYCYDSAGTWWRR